MFFQGRRVPAVSAKGGLMMGTKKVGVLPSRLKRTNSILSKILCLSSNKFRIEKIF